jgi:hypothetical protein
MRGSEGGRRKSAIRQLAGGLPYTFPTKGGPARTREDGTFRIELRSYDSPDDLGRGKYRSQLLEEEYPSRKLAEAEIAEREPELIASGALAIMVAVPHDGPSSQPVGVRAELAGTVKGEVGRLL